jgi:hypothetical protein
VILNRPAKINTSKQSRNQIIKDLFVLWCCNQTIAVDLVNRDDDIVLCITRRQSKGSAMSLDGYDSCQIVILRG